MIPEFFKENANLNIRVFDFQVNVNYVYHWPMRKADGKDPRVVHLEFRSDPHKISQTGYQSIFLLSAYLHEAPYRSIEELAIEMGQHVARENGYDPPEPGRQFSFF